MEATFPPTRSARVGDFSQDLLALRNARVLGINPPVYDFAWFDLWAKPAGLLQVLGALRERGNEVELLDCMHEGRETPLTCGRWKMRRERVEKPAPYRNVPRHYHRFGIAVPDLAARLAAMPVPDVVLVTSHMTYWYPGVYETIRSVRAAFPSARVVLGGIYATLCPAHAARSGADTVHVGSLPTRAAAPLPLDLYDAPRFGVLLTSSGCPLRCDYCASGLLQPEFRQRTPHLVLDDLAYQAAHAPLADAVFYDDALLWDKERHLLPLCRGIGERYPGLRLHAPNGLHVSLLDPACCRALFDAGLHTIRLSLEGTDDVTARMGARKAVSGDYLRAVDNLRDAGFQPERIETYLLVGLPGQRPEAVERAIDEVRAAGGRPKLAEFSPIPQTPAFAAAVRTVPEIASEPLLHNNTVYAPYVAGTVPPEELQRLKDRARR